MAAYGAAISLKNTIQLILQSSRISLVPPSPQVLQPVYEAMVRLQKVLLKLEDTGYSKIRTKVNDLDDRIKEVVWEFEDLLESLFTHQILPQLESERDHLSFSLDLYSLQQSVDCFVERVMVMKAEYDAELMNMPEEEGEPISSRIDFHEINSNMVGLTDQFEQARYDLLQGGNILSLTGMAGVGKTTLAKKVFDDPSIQRHFEYRVWVKVGRKCESNETLRCILAQVDPNTQGDDEDEKLVRLLGERLKDKKCLIVLDDVWEWDTRVMDNLPNQNVRILLTSRLANNKSPNLVVRLLNEAESKELLGEKVFGEKEFPPHLDELGEKISQKCEALPLMIVTVAKLLSKANKSIAEELLSKANKSTQEELKNSIQEYWTEVAEKQHNSVFKDAYDHISEVLHPSYNYLPQYLKMVFLYMGASPPYSDINMHSLFYRLSAEGFLEPIREQNFEDMLSSFLADLVHDYYLVLYELNPASWFSKNMFRVHSCWQYLCRKEARKVKFLLVLQSCDDVMKDQRRLCAQCNTLFTFKQVYNSIQSDCASTARSFLCYGPYHQYPVPIQTMDFKLLRILEALSVRFYHFPLEILKLVCLKYLALTCNKDLPVSISNLFHLQFLIINQHMNIKKCGALSYMPMEVWNMQDLQVIQIPGRDLQTPDSDATLDKLSYLFDVSSKSCTREILKRIPNLKSLGIQMELTPHDDDNDSNPMSGLKYISKELQMLEALAYVVVNPEMQHKSIVPLSMFPSSLRTLVLSGLGCPWKRMNDIGSRLPNLISLELQCYAFRGPEWNIESRSFLKLETLVIEDADLMRWRARYGSLPRLELLSLRHCYKLQQLEYWAYDPSVVTVPTIELVDCNPSALLYSGRHVRQDSQFKVRFSSSFDIRSHS